jgi:hypothetical protein
MGPRHSHIRGLHASRPSFQLSPPGCNSASTYLKTTQSETLASVAHGPLLWTHRDDESYTPINALEYRVAVRFEIVPAHTVGQRLSRDVC